jgi:hypothetical protein
MTERPIDIVELYRENTKLIQEAFEAHHRRAEQARLIAIGIEIEATRDKPDLTVIKTAALGIQSLMRRKP